MNTASFFRVKKKWHYLALLAVITLITYWPLAFGTFSLKNDAFIYFLPWRFQISESIQHGYYPFWTPYLYTGLPLYSDMQSGAWNPVVLIISLLTRYNMQILQWELLFYIFIGGVGMYKLIKAFGYSEKACTIGAITYICCGFITDSGSFIPWITCAGYIPFLFLYFYRLLNKPSFITSVKFSLILFLLLSAGYPSYLIYAGYIIIATLIFLFIKNLKNSNAFFPLVKYLLTTVILFSILSLPVILSFTDFTSYYRRGAGASLDQVLTDPFNLFCSISYLFPSSVAKQHEWFHTDIAMRNAYIGIFTLGFLVVSLRLPYSNLKKLIIGITLFSFIFSLGSSTPLREWCYKLLPLMNSFRHPAIIRLFTSIGIILLASQSIDLYFREDNNRIKNTFKYCMIFIAAIIAVFIIYYAFHDIASLHLFDFSGNIKTLIDRINLPEIVIMQGMIQLIFIFLFLFLRHRKKILIALMLTNIVFFAIAALPFSFISQTKTKSIDNYISSFPPGFPTPSLNDSISSNNVKPFGVNYSDYDGFYNKRITIQEKVISPTVNRSYNLFLTNKSLLDSLRDMPFAFISTPGILKDSTAALKIKTFSPDKFVFNATITNPGYLNLMQQYHHNWVVRINKTKVIPEKAFMAFMKVKVPAGSSEISFEYKPGSLTVICMIISAVTFLSLLIYLLVTFTAKQRLLK